MDRNSPWSGLKEHMRTNVTRSTYPARIAISFLSLAIGSFLRAQTLYVATGSNGVASTLYSVNPATGASTSIGSVTISGNPIGLTGLAFHPSTNVLYGVTTNPSGGITTNRNCLVTINPANASATLVGPLLVGGLGRNISDIAFSATGTLYGWANSATAGASELATINLTTGGVTIINSDYAGSTKGGGLAFTTADADVLYMSPATSSETLWKINRSTGAATPGPTMNAGFPNNFINAMAYSTASSAMYGVNSYIFGELNGLPSAEATLVTINTSSGNVAPLGALPRDTDAMAFSMNFDSWRKWKFTAAEVLDANVSGPNAVYGQDGLSNLVKYALGLEPKQNSTTGLPSVTVSGSEWVFTYTRPSRLTDVFYSVEVSTNIVSWTTAGVTHELVSTANYIDTWRGRYPLSSASNAFFRLNTKHGTTTTVTVSNATYDNASHGGTASVAGFELSQSLTVTYTGILGTVYGASTTAPTNAGDYSASASYAGDANYANSSDSKNYTINKASSTTTIAAVSPVTYDASAHPYSTVSVTGVGGLNLTAPGSGLTVNYYLSTDTGFTSPLGAPTNAGNYVVRGLYAGDANHNGSSGTAPIVIDKASSTTTVIVSNAPFDGNPHGGSATVTGAGGLSQSLTVIYEGINGTVYSASTTAPTAVGDYSASASYAGDTNHSGSADSKNFSITP
jgi:hypothetical protein